MDFQWIAIAMGDVVWMSLAFALGFMSRSVGLPPMVGFLVAGFVLSTQGVSSGEVLQKLSDLGITLLLFTVGLKLNLRTLARPQVWAVTGLHMSMIVVAFGFAIYGLALLGTPLFSTLDLTAAMLIAFALSFSSTVFVVKVLEAKGELTSLHGRIAMGILIMQDLAAVIFLAISMGKMPSPWALLIVLLIPLRPLLLLMLQRVGRGELMVLYGFLLALGGAEVFELVGLKGDLGALIIGALIASHQKAEELAKTMLSFKDLFLLGFFLSIGMSGQLTWEIVAISLLITALLLFKSALFFGLLAAFKLRARTSLLASLNLTNYSEFGLIVAAIGVASGWLQNDWLMILALCVSLSFVISAILNASSKWLYIRHGTFWRRFERPERLADDRLIDIHRVTVIVIGMGRVGTGAYDRMRELHGDCVLGIDTDPVIVRQQRTTGRKVLPGDPSDADFWDRVQKAHTLKLVMLTLPKLNSSLAVLEQLAAASFKGQVAATARFSDEVDALQQAGASPVFNIYAEAGAGFAAHVLAHDPGQSGKA